ncbi:hypothetical protein ACTFIW_000477 [Dictyostelium discoideum]
MSPFQIVYGFKPPNPLNNFNSLTKTRIPMSNIKKINCGPFIITAILGKNVTLDLVCYPKKHNVFNNDQIVKIYEDSEWLREKISMPEPEVMDEASYEVESILNHDKVELHYLFFFLNSIVSSALY